MTFNVHHGVGDDGRHDLARVAQLLASTDADVICLQEVDRHFGPRSEGVDQALLLARALDMGLAWGPAIDRPGTPERRQYGNALLSRLPVLDRAVHLLPGGGEPRSALRVRVRLNGCALWVTTTHLSSRSAADRAAQAAAVVELHTGPGEAGVVAGDLNADAGAPELDALRQRFADAWPLASVRADQGGRWSLHRDEGRTHPARRPHVRIDQVWVSAGVTVPAAQVLDGSACSDHHPLLVDLGVRSGV
ncbi:Metal-dependent hydrolase, endonuclease/exonuclease/phosphatase family [Modestobacter sp. DSM 44400]|uniref:endonuclease/exonuclease/phosphatase family protein n=1 Tax=Modestobacter sp. DSM 44400 TaxID=1550230 RepID=UPI0008972668|nr:endonuclease/exonuclease/phosphatase family protein [Modestobacter sp. DSM 44400]SDX68028.1 Metal-dependent hydrolase, endonuclease/exonuclease/phosphatase family [Modestobacter sp. DSM 44400]